MKSKYSHSHRVSFRLIVRDNASHIVNQEEGRAILFDYQ